MKEINDLQKRASNLVTIENAEEYYKQNNGNITHNISNTNLEFYTQHFSKEKLLKWNEEIVKKLIEEYKEEDKRIYTEPDKGWKHFNHLVQLVCFIYVEDKNIYVQRIELLKELYKKYGYFMNYYCRGALCPIDIEECMCEFSQYWYQMIGRETDIYPYTDLQDPSKSAFYAPERYVTGLIPDLYYLGYYDLLDKYLSECYLPICQHYQERGKYFDLLSRPYCKKDFDIRYNYAMYGKRTLIEAILFLRAKGHKLPEKLDEYWKEKGV